MLIGTHMALKITCFMYYLLWNFTGELDYGGQLGVQEHGSAEKTFGFSHQ